MLMLINLSASGHKIHKKARRVLRLWKCIGRKRTNAANQIFRVKVMILFSNKRIF